MFDKKPTPPDIIDDTSESQNFGNQDAFKLITRTSSHYHVTRTMAMEIEGTGCVVRVSSEFRDYHGTVSSATDNVTYVPGVCIENIVVDGVVTGRRLVNIHR